MPFDIQLLQALIRVSYSQAWDGGLQKTFDILLTNEVYFSRTLCQVKVEVDKFILQLTFAEFCENVCLMANSYLTLY